MRGFGLTMRLGAKRAVVTERRRAPLPARLEPEVVATVSATSLGVAEEAEEARGPVWRMPVTLLIGGREGLDVGWASR